MTTKTLSFLETPVKMGGIREMKNKVSEDYLGKIDTGRIIWHLIKRHKFGLVCTWAVLITISYMFPPIWDILGLLI